MVEQWRPISGYEDLYMVSSDGRVKSLDRFVLRKDGRSNFYSSRILRQSSDAKGYKRVGLSKNGRTKDCLVHRLVAEAFISNPDHLPQVNHINEKKNDNRVENLEWMTCSENVNHGTGKARCGKAHEFPVIMVKSDGERREFSSASAAAKELGIVSQGIQGCCTGRFKTYKGCRWFYKDGHRSKVLTSYYEKLADELGIEAQ